MTPPRPRRKALLFHIDQPEDDVSAEELWDIMGPARQADLLGEFFDSGNVSLDDLDLIVEHVPPGGRGHGVDR